MNDPTYVTAEIHANPIWKLAHWMSEIDNDNAPIGWSRYIPLARAVLAKFDLMEREVAFSETPATITEKDHEDR